MTAPSIKDALELKPCPFCGGTDLEFAKQDNSGAVVVRCEDCFGRTGAGLGEDAAASYWNTRDEALATLSPPAGERREALARLICEYDCGEKREWDAEYEGGRAYFLNMADDILASGLVPDEAGDQFRRVALDRLDKLTKAGHALKRIQKGEADPVAIAAEALQLMPWTTSNE